MLLLDLFAIVSVFAILYAHYRIFIYQPAIASRFVGTLDLEHVFDAFRGFQKVIAIYATAEQTPQVLAIGPRFDVAVALAIFASGVATIAFVASATEPPPRTRVALCLAAGIVTLYFLSSAAYVVLAAQAHVVNFPPRYLHLSGMLALSACAVGLASAPAGLRKFGLIVLVMLGTCSAVLTFAIKVSTLEAARADLEKRIRALDAPGDIAFDTPPGASGYMNPYFLEPATSPYTGYWILENYCPLILGRRCVVGSGKPGDIVVTPLHYREGYLTESRVEVRR